MNLVAIILGLSLISGCGSGKNSDSEFLNHEPAPPVEEALKGLNKTCPITLEKMSFCLQIVPMGEIKSHRFSHFQLLFWKKGTAVPTRPAAVIKASIWMDMSHMGMPGHGGNNGALTLIRDGEYEWRDVGFTMDGVWQLKFLFMGEDGSVLDEVTHAIKVPS